MYIHIYIYIYIYIPPECAPHNFARVDLSDACVVQIKQ